MKKIIPINDGWLFAEGFSRSCLEPDFEFGNFYPVSLPHNAKRREDGYFDKTETAVYTYAYLLALDEKYNGSRLQLVFDGVSSYAEVYINGTFVTSHKGDTPFTVDATAPLKAGFQNMIIVKVDSRLKKDAPLTTGLGPMPSYGGIHRRVWLNVSDGVEISDIFIRTSAVSDGACEMDVAVTLGDFYPETQLCISIEDASGKEVGSLPPKAVLSREVALKGVIRGVEEWSLDKPALYRAVATLKYEDTIMDFHSVTFGFRTLAFKRDGFYLNGEKIKLIGLNRIDSFPLVGRAATEALQRYDARKIKELGCNVVRTHGLAEKSFIDECDRIGLLVVSGISGDGYIGGSAWKDALVRTVEDTVKRDRNNPSVIAWGVRVNNSPDCDELYFKTSKTARDNDPTRPAFGTRNFMGSRLYEDVFAYNDYNEKGGLSGLKKTCRLFVPYFVSEHTGRVLPTKRFDIEARRNEQAQRHLKAIDDAFKMKTVCGCAGMSYADFLSVWGSENNIAYYGVLDGYRIEKTAAYAYKTLSKEKFLYPTSTLSSDEFCGKLSFYTNCDSVKLYRDDALVGEFFPDKKKYKYLPHPPIEADDLIGGLPQEKEGMSAKQAKLFKYIVAKVKQKSGIFNLSAPWKFAAFVLRKMLKLTNAAFKKLVHKYAYAPSVFKAEGIVDGKVAVERYVTPPDGKKRLRLKVSDRVLRPGSSYETALVTVESTDSAGNVLNYDFSPISISVEGELRLVGESTISLKGGAVGFMVMTTPYDGSARISVQSAYGTEVLDLEVARERVEEL